MSSTTSSLAAEYRALISYSRRLTGNAPEATDLVHIVFTRVLSQPTPVAAVENVSGWLRTVLFHTFIDLRRRARWKIPTESTSSVGTRIDRARERLRRLIRARQGG